MRQACAKDKVCIHQTNGRLKAGGTLSIGGILKHSEAWRMALVPKMKNQVFFC